MLTRNVKENEIGTIHSLVHSLLVKYISEMPFLTTNVHVEINYFNYFDALFYFLQIRSFVLHLKHKKIEFCNISILRCAIYMCYITNTIYTSYSYVSQQSL